MNVEEKTTIKDNVTVIVIDLDAEAQRRGCTIEELEALICLGATVEGKVQTTHNLVVNGGLNLFVSRLGKDTDTRITHMAIGTSNTAPAVGQTALVAEIFRDQITQVITGVSTGVATIKFYISSAYCNGSTLREAGIFNAASTGTMFARALISPEVVKTTSIGVIINWEVTVV